jgi:hypothetical protein
VPSESAPDPASIPLKYTLNNYRATVTTTTDGDRTQVSASFVFQGSIMMLQ